MILLVLLLVVAPVEAATDRVEVVHQPGQADLAETLARQTEKALSRLEAEFGLKPEGRVSIILTSSQSEFMRAQPRGAPVPEWAAGTAWPEFNLIVLKTRQAAAGTSPEKVLLHELAHLVLGRLFQTAAVPTWLNEGLAMHLADDWDPGRQLIMARALASERLIPLSNLVEGFPEERFEAATAYAESYYLVAFLKDRYGPEAMGRLIRHIGLGASPRHVLLQITGWPADRLEEEFNKWLRRRFSVFWIVTNPESLWLLAALLLLAAVWIKRRAARRRLADWEAADEAEKDSGRSGRIGRQDRTQGPL
ncbi:MAG: peptidase MA family metallohydrolase [Thermodesulfobacteriota bacterium]